MADDCDAEFDKPVVEDAALPVINVISERKSNEAFVPPPKSSVEVIPQYEEELMFDFVKVADFPPCEVLAKVWSKLP